MVEEEIDKGFRTEYRLVGIEGEFNSICFDSVTNLKFAFATEIPKAGTRIECDVILMKEGEITIACCETSVAQLVEEVDSNVYVTVTKNSVYVISCRR